MDVNQDSPAREQPAEEKAASSGNGQGRHSRRRGSRRPRFRRGRRGNRPDQPDAEHPPGTQIPKEPENVPSAAHSGIRKVIGQMEQIRSELERALDDIHEALHTLEQVEREKTATDEEIESLRESLKQLHHGPGNSRHARYPEQKPAPTPAHDESDPDAEREPD